jgi:hypothetical protein
MLVSRVPWATTPWPRNVAREFPGDAAGAQFGVSDAQRPRLVPHVPTDQLIINRNVPEIGMHFFRIRSITGGNLAWNPREWSHNPDLALNRRSGAGVLGGI